MSQHFTDPVIIISNQKKQKISSPLEMGQTRDDTSGEKTGPKTSTNTVSFWSAGFLRDTEHDAYMVAGQEIVHLYYTGVEHFIDRADQCQKC